MNKYWEQLLLLKLLSLNPMILREGINWYPLPNSPIYKIMANKIIFKCTCNFLKMYLKLIGTL